MKRGSFGAWLAFALGMIYFLAPLVATVEFSMRVKRDGVNAYSFESYIQAFANGNFQASFLYSVALALAAIILGVALVLPTAYFVQLRLRKLHGLVEFITLLPLVIPAIVLVFGYIRLYDTSSYLPLTGSAAGTNVLLTLGYVALAMPYMYRAVDTGLSAIDVRTLTEAAEIQGADWFVVMTKVILPNIRVSILSGAFLTFAIVIGEFTFASLLNCLTFGPYLQRVGAKQPYESAALSVMAFAITWACMGLIQFLGRGVPSTAGKR